MTDLVIERHFNTDVETVFAFVTQRSHLLEWWGPEGMNIKGDELDFSKPGDWKSTMVNADGGAYTVSGKVKSVETPNHVSITWAWHDENGDRGHDSEVHIDLTPNGEGTDFRLTHKGLADEESAANHNTGWTSSLRKLERKAG